MDPRFVVKFMAGRHYWSVQVGRLRADAATVEDVLNEVRSLGTARNRSLATWGVAASATPADLSERLVGLGLKPEGTSDVLLLTDAPRRGPAEFEVRAADSLEDHLARIEVAAAAFAWSAADTEDERSRAEATQRAERLGGHTARLIAFENARPVATGQAWYSPKGLYLGGGATLPTDRGRGAMTSLVAAAWDEAVRHGTPALVTYGGALSSPILMRLGFRKMGELVHLIDRW